MVPNASPVSSVAASVTGNVIFVALCAEIFVWISADSDTVDVFLVRCFVSTVECVEPLLDGLLIASVIVHLFVLAVSGAGVTAAGVGGELVSVSVNPSVYNGDATVVVVSEVTSFVTSVADCDVVSFTERETLASEGSACVAWWLERSQPVSSKLNLSVH